MPSAISVGVPYDTFWHLTPKKLNAFFKANKLKLKVQDEQMWLMGQYVLSAVSVAVEHCLAGRKAKSKYVKQPFTREVEEQNKPLTEEELQRQRELFVAKLEIMKTNFELNHKNQER